ncbi:MAG TPA: hypothetical protein VM513_19405, partial [Kofleriaceae bacterium]|nr:hypothetical protein [Kofleriaceae bacterium]
RTRRADTGVAIVRFEKLYPWWPELVAAQTLDKYPKMNELFWVQDEPHNMGAATFVTPRLEQLIKGTSIRYDEISHGAHATRDRAAWRWA